MGNYLYKAMMCRKEVRILYMGLNAAGKTTILYRLKLGQVVDTAPTMTFNLETIKHNGARVTVWDIGSRDKSRPINRHYLPGTDGLVFIIDSSDRKRLTESIEDLLRRLTEEDELRGIPVLVLANKQDVKNAMTPEEIRETVKVSGYLRCHPWEVFGTSGINGDGLHESLDWLTGAILYDKKKQFMDTFWP